jgi:hypothetical protein
LSSSSLAEAAPNQVAQSECVPGASVVWLQGCAFRNNTYRQLSPESGGGNGYGHGYDYGPYDAYYHDASPSGAPSTATPAMAPSAPAPTGAQASAGALEPGHAAVPPRHVDISVNAAGSQEVFASGGDVPFLFDNSRRSEGDAALFRAPQPMVGHFWTRGVLTENDTWFQATVQVQHICSWSQLLCG